jgi:hypothetical protein
MVEAYFKVFSWYLSVLKTKKYLRQGDNSATKIVIGYRAIASLNAVSW